MKKVVRLTESELISFVKQVVNESTFFRRRVDIDRVTNLLATNGQEVYHDTDDYEQFKYELTLRAVEAVIYNKYGLGWEDLPELEEIRFVTDLSNILEELIIKIYKQVYRWVGPIRQHSLNQITPYLK
jgi:fido (protein-threonine AMPylation protein)